MKKILNFIKGNLLFLATLFLLAFIPLYPKLPIVDVTNTWVYVRAEDFVVAAVLTLWIFLILIRKVKLKTPLTIPIFLFWAIGAISTLHGVLLIFPTLPNVFPNVAFLSLLRRVEYMSLFFIAFASMTNKKFIYHIIAVLSLTLLLIFLYGLGQKFLGFPAFLTGNEEFAKGVALRVSSLGRIPSTFAGHYDLGAYLVLTIPLLVSLAFGFKNLILKTLLFIVSFMGLGLLFMTVSRVSFFALLIALLVLLILHRKKFFIISLAFLTAIFLIISPNLLSRFQSTITEVNVLVDTETETALGQVKEVSNDYFKDKIILRDNVATREAEVSTASATISYEFLPPNVDILMQPNISTGENLPQGTGYVNLPMSPTIKRVEKYITEKSIDGGIPSDEVRLYEGFFLVKKARAYDLSFTTRFQGEWPRAIEYFKKNIFLGSGYGSLGLAVDNDYLRLLGESGLFGFASFVLLFLVAFLYIRKSLPKVTSPVVKSFVLGFITGTIGLLLNGILIDVFEASKIAYSYWLLMGVTLGILHLYNPKEDLQIMRELKKILTAPLAIVIYIFTGSAVLFLTLIGNYFVGDDFTWLRWAAGGEVNILKFFTESDGFFYRPGAKLYFLLMYKFFWLNQIFYHLVSIALHAFVVLLLFVILRKVLKSFILSIVGVVLFLALSGHYEAIFWISATGFLFTSLFTLLSLLLFIFWKEKKNNIFLLLSLISVILSFLFHELGVVAPLIIISYELVFSENSLKERLFKRIHLLFLAPLLPYLLLRFIAGSHWFSGDYSYNIVKLPFNVIGNTVGYLFLDLFGPWVLGTYELLRTGLRTNLIFSGAGLIVLSLIFVLLGKVFWTKLEKNERKILIFGALFFVVSLLPFLGLGNISSRYGYLSSVGLVIFLPVIFKKVYIYLQSLEDKHISLMAVFLIAVVFLSTQLFQLQKVHSDWKVAGDSARNFLVSFQGFYKDYWKDRSLNFYFVDTPIKNGQAWVFPVGLRDAVWFSFKDLDITVNQSKSLNDAFFQAKDPFTSSVFQFDESGRVHELERNLSGDVIEKK